MATNWTAKLVKIKLSIQFNSIQGSEMTFESYMRRISLQGFSSSPTFFKTCGF